MMDVVVTFFTKENKNTWGNGVEIRNSTRCQLRDLTSHEISFSSMKMSQERSQKKFSTSIVLMAAFAFLESMP